MLKSKLMNIFLTFMFKYIKKVILVCFVLVSVINIV